MNRELFQRYALVTIVVLLAVFAVNARPWRQFAHRNGDHCRVERNVERHVHRSVSIAPLPPLPPIPPLPPMPPMPPPAVSPDDGPRAERAMREYERRMARFEARVAREMRSHERALEDYGRRMEHRAPRAHAMTLMSLAPVSRRDEVVYERSFNFRAGDLLQVELSSENVVVETSASNATVRVIGHGRDARAEFERRRFEASYSGGALRVRTNPQRRIIPRRVQADYTVVIALPTRARLDIAASSGDVRVDHIEGQSANVTTSSGNMELGTLRANEIELTASSGDITADALQGDVEIATSSGNVMVNRLAGPAASVTASSGDITIRRAESEDLSVATSSGNVDARGIGAESNVATGSGNISLGFSRAAPIEVRSGSGEVNLSYARGAGADVDLSGSDVAIADALAFDGTRARRSVRGRIGRGGPEVSVATGSGSIELSAR